MKILIVRLGSLGDVVHTIPAQQFLVRRYPGSEIHWLVEPPYDRLLARIPNIHKIWTADTKLWRKELRHLSKAKILISELRGQHFDLTVDFQGLVKSALLSRLSGASRVVGYRKKWLRETQAAWFYTERIGIEDGQRHQIEYLMDLVEPPRFKGPISPQIPLDIPAEAYNYVDDHLERLQAAHPVLLNPGAGWETKRWAPDCFARLGRMIEERLDIPVIVTYGPAEQRLVELIQAETQPRPLRTFPTDLLQLAALCRRSQLMVAGDTGPLHLAVALGLATVAVLGPAFPWRTGPFCQRDVILQHELPCPHPYKRTCREHFCMDISVERVFSGVVARLGIEADAKRPFEPD